MIVLAVLGLGILAGWIVGGRLRNLRHLHLAGESTLVAFVLMTALVPRAFEFAAVRWHDALLVVWAVMMGILVWLSVLNVKTPGIALLGLGLAANTLVILANRGMPVSEAAVRLAGGGEAAIRSLPTAAFHRSVEGATLWWLGDVIPLPGLRMVASVGDILMFAGLVVTVAWGMTLNPPGSKG